MVEIFTYRVDVFEAEPIELTGYDVEAADGHIGKIDEATTDAGASCLVVDTGFWIFGKKRMIPAGVVTDVDVESKVVRVKMTKADIKAAPDYDPERHAADANAHHAEQAWYFGQFGT
jgi:hypothetical protein